jgi:hypothetical protein
MKFSFSVLTLLSGNIFANAFPSLHHKHLESLTPEKLNAALQSVEEYKHAKRFFVDAKKPIDITGKHAFKAPRGNDQRGPCPGLNALANHGYISRDGVTSFAEVVTAINQGLFGIFCNRDGSILTQLNSSFGHGHGAGSYPRCDGYRMDRKPTVVGSWFLHRRSNCRHEQYSGKSAWSSW